MKPIVIRTIVALVVLQLVASEGEERQIREASRFFDSVIDPSVQPCKNFQKYACGNYRDDFSCCCNVFASRRDRSCHGDRHAEVDRILFAMLTSLNYEDVAIATATQKARDFFDKCVDESEIRKTGDKTVLDELERVGFERWLWPQLLVDSDYSKKLDYVKIWAKILQYPTMYANFLALRVDVIEDSAVPGKYVPLIRTEPNDPIEYVPRGAYDAHFLSFVMDYFKPQKPVKPHHLRVDGRSRLESVEDERVKFWRKLRQISTRPRSAAETTSQPYARTNLRELQISTHNWIANVALSESHGKFYNSSFAIDWKNFFEVLFEDALSDVDGSSLDGDDSKFVVYVSDMEKLQNIVETMVRTRSVTIAYSLWLTTVMNTIPMASRKLQSAYLDGAKSFPKILTHFDDPPRRCLAIVKDTFRSVVAHELLRNVTDDDEHALLKMIDEINVTFVNEVKRMKWLSDEMRETFLSKIENLRVRIPYIKTTRNSNDLRDDYEEINMDGISFYDAYTQILRIKRKKEFARIFNPNDRHSHLESSPPVDVFSEQPIVKYRRHTNEIELSILVFGHPYFYGSAGIFRPLNLGGAGFHIVREVAYSLNEMNTFADGQPTPSPYTENAISNITKMLRRTVKSREIDAAGWRIAQLEAIADSVSLNVCYRTLNKLYSMLAYHSNTLVTSMMRIMTNFERTPDTPAQYFTLALAMTMCRESKTPNTTYIDYTERVNELFKHWTRFKTIWNCSDNAFMTKLPKNEGRIHIFSNEVA